MNIEFDQIESLNLNGQAVKKMYLGTPVTDELVFPPIDSNTIWFDFATQYSEQEIGPIIFIARNIAFMKDGSWGEGDDYYVHIHAKTDPLAPRRGIRFRPSAVLTNYYKMASSEFIDVKCFLINNLIYVVFYGKYTDAASGGGQFPFMDIWAVDNTTQTHKYTYIGINSTFYTAQFAQMDIAYSPALDSFILVKQVTNTQYKTYLIKNTTWEETGIIYTRPADLPTSSTGYARGGVAAIGDYVVLRYYSTPSSGSGIIAIHRVNEATHLYEESSVGNIRNQYWQTIGQGTGFIVTASNVLYVSTDTWNYIFRSLFFVNYGEISVSPEGVPQMYSFPNALLDSNYERMPKKYFYRTDFNLQRFTLVSKLKEEVQRPVVFSDDKNLWGDASGKVRYFRAFKGGVVYS